MSWLISKAMMDNYGNLHYSQEQEAGFSEENYSDGEPSVQSSGNPTQLVFSSADKTKEFSRRSLSGMTFKPLTVDLGEAVLMSFLEAFPVRTFPAQEKEQVSKESDLPCGSTWQELSMKCVHEKSSSKIRHNLLWEEDLEPSSLTLPKWGMMLDGELWERTTLPPLTSGTGSGSWATPTTMDKLPPKSAKALQREATEARPGRSKPANLRDQVSNMKNWQNQNASFADTYLITNCLEGSVALTASEKEAMWPTPAATDCKGTVSKEKSKQRQEENARGVRLPEEIQRRTKAEVGCQLSPDWVEWLMGWPIGWTSLEPIGDLDWRDWKTDPADGDEIPRVATGIKCRADRLKAIGNGQVPQVAALAWNILNQYEI